MNNKTKPMLFILGTDIPIGALTGLGLSFTALSPLVMGGIIAAIPALLHFALCTGERLSQSQFSYAHACAHACLFVASAAIGVGLAAAATAISPSIMLGMGSAALAGAIIAPIAVIAGFLVAFGIIEPIAQKVNEYIISPIVERFSSKEQGV
ncbi:hypothetical protein [Wolbachia endosymbiont (group B) of Melanostoma mellinum]|uniref:hypothetical protein n=1 Tax=Wolbachia endosymbiont (group B) of Melanostoma mellinum TaxID=2954030 RepID=UPI00222F96CB|nr:hypothetical protein [Wolbachia endosymbiont (group B) of Melanostoma mellinum]